MYKKTLLFSLNILGLIVYCSLISAQEELIAIDDIYTQNFDSLPLHAGSSGTTSFSFINNTTLMGWYSSTNAARASSGSTSESGTLFSWGNSSSSDRALGPSDATGFVADEYLGVQLKNVSGSMLSAINLKYVLEEWRGDALTVSTWHLEYLITSTSGNQLEAAGYTSVAGSSASTKTTGYGVNGNLESNQSKFDLLLTDLDWHDGEFLWLRWVDEAQPADASLGLDDFEVSGVAVVLLSALGDMQSFATIQAALDAAVAGDTVILSEGVYHENVTFTASGSVGAPITLRAAAGAHVVLDGALAELQSANVTGEWVLYDASHSIYRTSVPYEGSDADYYTCTFVSRMGDIATHGCDRLLSPYASLDTLKAAPRGEGSFRDGVDVYVRLNDGVDPNTVGLSIGQALGVVDTNGQSHLRIEGLEIRNSGWAGICLSGTGFEDIEINNVIIRNSFRGISTVIPESSENIGIYTCGIYNGFDRDWLRYGGYVVGIGAHSGGEQYSPYRGHGILIDGDHTEIANCNIAGQWDAIKTQGYTVQIHHNTMHHIKDDAVELESNRSGDVEFYNNLMYDVFTAVSVTPSYPGPFYVYRNSVQTTRKENSTPTHTVHGYGIKSGNHYGPYVTKNVKVYQNSFYSIRNNVWEKLNDTADNEWDAYEFVNNVFYIKPYSTPNVNFRGLDEDESGADNYWEANFYNFYDLPSVTEEANAELSSNDIHFYMEIPIADQITSSDLRLTASSPALNSGSSYPTLQGWPDSISIYPNGRDRGAYEEGMLVDSIGSNWTTE
ncbi:right-handed parallel beta-helix repeat-containing protein [Coraliomargarita sp. SDUM461004]|uniref:Right-handed parallel beta-helix repeat-containing protein n=1 Tax=Thalassobacterium sedimentorum TaxID=3041258 RepID=A0ABU1AJ23_9BACT|nr:right-handed parallel beta-helix repeat-containing protein [Coraliomargarita sp. SDUM461004]MDQ8193613.1 right-handed parallel beta-helix repeat-containing protein [Coraliomargarita sp. SDUM461004]